MDAAQSLNAVCFSDSNPWLPMFVRERGEKAFVRVCMRVHLCLCVQMVSAVLHLAVTDSHLIS